MAQKALKLLKTLSGHSGAIYDVVASDHFVYTTSADRFVVRWDILKGIQDNFTVKLEHSAFNLALDPTRDFLVIGNSKGGLHCVDLVTKEESRYITQHKAPVFSLTYEENKDVFYSGDGDGYFCVWEAETMKLLITLPLDCGKIRQITADEEGNHIAICGQDGRLRILETDFFNEVQTLSINKVGVNTAQFLKEKLIVGGKDARISIWNWRNKDCILQTPAHNYAVYDLALFDRNTHLTSVSFDKTIKYWSLPDLEILQRIEFKDDGHRHTVNRIAKINEKTFVTVSDDAQIKVWKLSSLD